MLPTTRVTMVRPGGPGSDILVSQGQDHSASLPPQWAGSSDFLIFYPKQFKAQFFRGKMAYSCRKGALRNREYESHRIASGAGLIPLRSASRSPCDAGLLKLCLPPLRTEEAGFPKTAAAIAPVPQALRHSTLLQETGVRLPAPGIRAGPGARVTDRMWWKGHSGMSECRPHEGLEAAAFCFGGSQPPCKRGPATLRPQC